MVFLTLTFPTASASQARPGPRRRGVPALFSTDGPQQRVSVQPSPGTRPRAVWTEHPAAAGRWIFCPARSAAPHTGRQLGVLLPQGQHGALVGEHPCLIAAKLGVGRVELPAQLFELGRPGRSGQSLRHDFSCSDAIASSTSCSLRWAQRCSRQSPGKAVPADAAPASGAAQPLQRQLRLLLLHGTASFRFFCARGSLFLRLSTLVQDRQQVVVVAGVAVLLLHGLGGRSTAGSSGGSVRPRH